jgi:DNA-binding winged helix-turn-helix (wHTH) protein
MRSPRADTSLVINVVSEDAVLVDRLELYARRSRVLSIQASASPLAEREVDAFVMPAPAALALLNDEERPGTWLPVVAYGDRGSLRLAFMAGCDDYLKDPWTAEEMHLRVQRLVQANVFPVGSAWVTYSEATVRSNAGMRDISFQEYAILRALATNRDRAVPRDVLYYAIWGETGKDSRVVDMHISSLRRKLRAILPKLSASKQPIRTVRKIGYMLDTSRGA